MAISNDARLHYHLSYLQTPPTPSHRLLNDTLFSRPSFWSHLTGPTLLRHAVHDKDNVSCGMSHDDDHLSSRSSREAVRGRLCLASHPFLRAAGVRVTRAVQNPGEFIITFPRGYHAGFSNGFNVGEATNFATADWFRFGADSCLRYSRLRRPPMLAVEQLLCTEAELVKGAALGGGSCFFA